MCLGNFYYILKMHFQKNIAGTHGGRGSGHLLGKMKIVETIENKQLFRMYMVLKKSCSPPCKIFAGAPEKYHNLVF